MIKAYAVFDDDPAVVFVDDVGRLDGEKRERFAGLLEVGRRRGLDVPRGRRDVGATWLRRAGTPVLHICV
jgi:hypothetical protein